MLVCVSASECTPRDMSRGRRSENTLFERVSCFLLYTVGQLTPCLQTLLSGTRTGITWKAHGAHLYMGSGDVKSFYLCSQPLPTK